MKANAVDTARTFSSLLKRRQVGVSSLSMLHPCVSMAPQLRTAEELRRRLAAATEAQQQERSRAATLEAELARWVLPLAFCLLPVCLFWLCRESISLHTGALLFPSHAVRCMLRTAPGLCYWPCCCTCCKWCECVQPCRVRVVQGETAAASAQAEAAAAQRVMGLLPRRSRDAEPAAAAGAALSLEAALQALERHVEKAHRCGRAIIWGAAFRNTCWTVQNRKARLRCMLLHGTQGTSGSVRVCSGSHTEDDAVQGSTSARRGRAREAQQGWRHLEAARRLGSALAATQARTSSLLRGAVIKCHMSRNGCTLPHLNMCAATTAASATSRQIWLL